MPRKLRPGKRRAETFARLSPKTIAVLLDGFGARAPMESPHGFGGGFIELYEAEDAGIIRLWTTHREALLAKAAEWPWTPRWELTDGTRVFFGEHIQRGTTMSGRKNFQNVDSYAAIGTQRVQLTNIKKRLSKADDRPPARAARNLRRLPD